MIGLDNKNNNYLKFYLKYSLKNIIMFIYLEGFLLNLK